MRAQITTFEELYSFILPLLKEIEDGQILSKPYLNLLQIMLEVNPNMRPNFPKLYTICQKIKGINIGKEIIITELEEREIEKPQPKNTGEIITDDKKQ